MKSINISYKVNEATVKSIEEHLNKCANLFNPRLDSYVNIKKYSEKIRENATTIEAWQFNSLIGLIACYLNNNYTLKGYITNVSITKDFQGKGIALDLMNMTINLALEKGFKKLDLEVEVDNTKAIDLYRKAGFVLSGREGNKYFMLNQLVDKKDVLVSICCVTYNHINYISDAINGFLMQKTTFPFEILIHDDASTDGTASIIKEYESKYFEIIKPIYQKENQYSQGRTISPVYQFPRANGKYIALCEGDDYWTDQYKLQKQVDFLEANPDCSLCFHASEHIYENKPSLNYIHRPGLIPRNNKFSIKHAIIGGGSLMTTNSMVFKREYLNDIPEWFSNAPIGDSPLMLLLASSGDIGYLDEVMSVYRKMSGNSWSNSMKIKEKRKKHRQAMLKMWDDFDEWSEYKYHKYVTIKKHINKYIIFRYMYVFIRNYLVRFIRSFV